MTDHSVAVGVVGVGSMGRNHARVYHELPEAHLVGVVDQDPERASEVADLYGADVMEQEPLFEEVDAVSIAVPTQHHYPVADAALSAGVHVLVEKPFVANEAMGRDLIQTARRDDLVLQVGHIERFNPAIQALADIIEDYDVIAVSAQRLGPPVDRQLTDGAVFDLMIHDIDVLGSLIGAEVTAVDAQRSTDDPYVTAALTFQDDIVGTLTASRVTQEKVRKLSITARECHIHVDYIDQSVTIHRQSLPEYVQTNGDVQFRHQNIVEQVAVDSGEPLASELQAFLRAVTHGHKPVVTGEDGLWAIDVARQVNAAASTSRDVAPAIRAP